MRLFGTDGIRGKANSWPILPELIVTIGRAVAYYFQRTENKKYFVGDNAFFPYNKHINDPQKLTVVIAKDTRLSGYMIETALTSGLTAQGANVIMLGPMPTPAVSMLVKSLRADIGIMISASHNPYYDNGIKFFNSNGIKFDNNIENIIENIVKNEEIPLPEDCGGAIRLDDAMGRYVEFAKATFPKGLSLDGVNIVLDCANGAAYKVAPKVFWELGARVTTIGNTPNGRNINEKCGALHPELLVKKVKELNSDIGIALDGDADRVFIVTKNGTIIDGDQILALIATDWSEKKKLSNGVVSTSMSNFGLINYLNELNIKHIESDVGDKNVLEMMNSTNSNLGGEESGHIILSDYTTTGDGIIAALQILGIMLEKNKKIDEIFPIFKNIPQVKKNIKLSSNINSEFIEELKNEGNKIIGNNGKLVIRKSGTEPLLRIMVQSEDTKLIDKFFTDFIDNKIKDL